MPNHLLQSTVASEDDDFYRHNGYWLPAIVKAVVENIKAGRPHFGGSTITQQLVKNTLLTPKKSFIRKYQESSGELL